MTSEQVDQQIGSWEDRQIWTEALAASLNVFLMDQQINAEILFRAKENQSIVEKLSRFDESLSEVHDLYGLRVVVKDFDCVEHLAAAVIQGFGTTPTDEEMMIRGGTLVFAPFRNYRKRDWIGVSPASSSGYVDAIHMNRKWNNRIVELQILTEDLFKKYCQSDADESHVAFKKRQAELYRS